MREVVSRAGRYPGYLPWGGILTRDLQHVVRSWRAKQATLPRQAILDESDGRVCFPRRRETPNHVS